MDEECNVCYPYADCKRQNDLVSIPNRDAGATISFPQTQHRSTGLDEHAKNYQQRCEGHSRGGEHLEEKNERTRWKPISFPLENWSAFDDLTHGLKDDHDLRIVGIVFELHGCRVTDIEKCTCLAINWSRECKVDDIDSYGNKGGYPRKGVNLTKRKVSPRCLRKSQRDVINSDPYCPTVGATPSDDTPLKFQSGDEFPAEKRNVEVIRTFVKYIHATHRKTP
jgi:hypothetical protein